jgi:hypothetical protein
VCVVLRDHTYLIIFGTNINYFLSSERLYDGSVQSQEKKLIESELSYIYGGDRSLSHTSWSVITNGPVTVNV